MSRLLPACFAFLAAGCSARLVDRPPPPIPAEARAVRERALAEAGAAHADATIWYARRLGYLHRYREAIEVLGEGIRRHPGDARLYRHRGHRWLTLRFFDRAIADLGRAAELRRGLADEIEPDGLPNAAGVPTSTLHGNIHYHLGLAHYAKGEFARAAAAWGEALRIATTDDARIAAGYWLALSLRRAGKAEEAKAVLAKLPADPRIVEDHAYHQLVRLFRGEITAAQLEARLAEGDDLDRVTIGYGLACHYRDSGDRARAAAKLEAVLGGGNWPAFGYLAAEADRGRR
jgi:tetratricopeptide (TPR) repeat protein